MISQQDALTGGYTKGEEKAVSRGACFGIFHPLVLLVFFLAVIFFTMFVIHPVYVGLSFAGALALCAYLQGIRRASMVLLAQIPLLVLVVGINPLFSSVGATELVHAGWYHLSLENVQFGVCMVMMLSAVVLWFANFFHIVSSDTLVSMVSKRIPIIGFMLSSVLRSVPRFARRGSQIAAVASACTSAGVQMGAPAKEQSTAGSLQRRATFTSRIRLVSVLMSWSMEDSLETSDAMRARGWGAGVPRTTYLTYRFRWRDGAAMLVVTVLVLVSACLAWTAYQDFHFYPTMTNLTLWWGYLPFLLLCMVPCLVCGADALRERL